MCIFNVKLTRNLSLDAHNKTFKTIGIDIGITWYRLKTDITATGHP